MTAASASNASILSTLTSTIKPVSPALTTRFTPSGTGSASTALPNILTLMGKSAPPVPWELFGTPLSKHVRGAREGRSRSTTPASALRISSGMGNPASTATCLSTLIPPEKIVSTVQANKFTTLPRKNAQTALLKIPTSMAHLARPALRKSSSIHRPKTVSPAPNLRHTMLRVKLVSVPMAVSGMDSAASFATTRNTSTLIQNLVKTVLPASFTTSSRRSVSVVVRTTPSCETVNARNVQRTTITINRPVAAAPAPRVRSMTPPSRNASNDYSLIVFS